MAALDEHVDRWAQSMLWPNEAVQVRAHGRRMPHGRQTYQEWLIAVTNFRILFFGAKETLGLSIAPNDSVRPFAIELRDLKNVWLRDTPGLTSMRRMTFVPILGRGPRETTREPLARHPELSDISSPENTLTLDLPAATRGMDDQQRFFSSFPQWLQQQVQARVYWGPEEHAALQAEADAARLEQERRAAAAAARKAQFDKVVAGALPFVKRYWPVLLYLVALVLVISGAWLTYSAYDHYSNSMQNRAITSLIGAAVCFVFSLLFLGPGVFFHLRIRKAMRAVSAPSTPANVSR